MYIYIFIDSPFNGRPEAGTEPKTFPGAGAKAMLMFAMAVRPNPLTTRQGRRIESCKMLLNKVLFTMTNSKKVRV